MTADTDESASVMTLLGQAVETAVFGNGWLVVLIVTILLAATVLSRVFKGGSL